MLTIKIATAVLLSSVFFISNVYGQNTGGVFGPVVIEGHEAVQYRLAFTNDNAFAQRIHYERATDSTLMWRVVAQSRKTNSSDVDFDFVQGELFWHITQDSSPWQTGLRFDVRVRDGDRHQTLGLNWMNQFRLSPDWQARLLALTTVDIDGGRNGIGLQTRANVFRSTPDNKQFGFELFSSYGTTTDFADLAEQNHTFGPFAMLPLGNGWSLFAGALFGPTDPASNSDIRLWITRNQ